MLSERPTVLVDKTENEVVDYQSCNLISKAMHERSDCSVVAVAVITDTPYPKVHRLHEECGRVRRCGTHHDVTVAVLDRLDFKMVDVTQHYPDAGSRTIRALGPKLIGGRYLIQTPRHILACINGQVQDWTQGRGHHVRKIWQVVPTTSPTIDPLATLPETITITAIPLTATPAHQLPLVGTVREKIIATAERMIHGRPIVASRRWWLAFRAEVMADLERIGIKRTTASIVLGQWQADIGYDHKRIGR